MQANRRPIKNKNRKIKWKILLLLFLIFVGFGTVYVIGQFKEGQNIAKSSESANNQTEPIEFTADEEDQGIENYLLLGIDSRGEEHSRTDTMMVVSWNHSTNDIKIVSFMRDIYADIPGYKKQKLNAAYSLGGVQLLKDTLNKMFDLPIHHYALIDFKNFETLVDIVAPNGIEIDVEKNMSKDIDVSLTKGVHMLNGKELLGYARFRQDSEGDFGRVRRQQQVIEAFKDQVISVSSVKNIPKLAGATQGYLTTDVSNKEQLETLAKMVSGGGMEIEKMTIPRDDLFKYDSISGVGSVLSIDLEKNKQALHDFLNLQ